VILPKRFEIGGLKRYCEACSEKDGQPPAVENKPQKMPTESTSKPFVPSASLSHSLVDSAPMRRSSEPAFSRHQSVMSVSHLLSPLPAPEKKEDHHHHHHHHHNSKELHNGDAKKLREPSKDKDEESEDDRRTKDRRKGSLSFMLNP